MIRTKISRDSGVAPLCGVTLTIYLWRYLGFFTLLIATGCRMISPAYAEAAYLDGASPFRTFVRITLKQLRPQLLFTATLSVAYAARLYREAFLLFGAYPPDSVYLLAHYQQNHFANR